jgi:hypothetical protein
MPVPHEQARLEDCYGAAVVMRLRGTRCVTQADFLKP